MIAPETLAAALRVAQDGARRAMLAVRSDDPAAMLDRPDALPGAMPPAPQRAAPVPTRLAARRPGTEAPRATA